MKELVLSSFELKCSILMGILLYAKRNTRIDLRWLIGGAISQVKVKSFGQPIVDEFTRTK